MLTRSAATLYLAIVTARTVVAKLLALKAQHWAGGVLSHWDALADVTNLDVTGQRRPM